jgi:ribonuclease BN (tRNA processing enzyme)
LPWLIIDGQFNGRRKPLVIAGPQRTEERFLAAFDALYPGAPEAERPFAVSVVEISERVRTEIGPAAVTTFGVIHTPAAFPHALRIEYGGKVIAYSGDTEWTDVLLEVADGADLFVCECQEYERSVPGHLNYMTLREKRPQFRCRRLVINHMGATMLARLDELDVEAAEDGLAIEV